jgi:peptide deformylase
MYSKGGVGLAAPQIGDERRILIADTGHADHLMGQPSQYGSSFLKMINPKIIKSSQEMIKFEEGCLSIPEFTVKVSRPAEITVEYFSPLGEVIVEDFSNVTAVIIQHEIEHLNGITLFDKASLFKKNHYLDKMKKLGEGLIRKLSNGK